MEYVDLELIVKRKIYLYQIHKKLDLIKKENFKEEIVWCEKQNYLLFKILIL